MLVALACSAGHCCVHRWRARAGCADASSSLWAASAEVKLRWVSVPAGGDHGGCAVVLALWALVPGRRRVAGRTGHRGRSRHDLSLGVHQFTPLLIDAARPCRHAPGDRWFVDETSRSAASGSTCAERSTSSARSLTSWSPRSGIWPPLADSSPAPLITGRPRSRSPLIARPPARGCSMSWRLAPVMSPSNTEKLDRSRSRTAEIPTATDARAQATPLRTSNHCRARVYPEYPPWP